MQPGSISAYFNGMLKRGIYVAPSQFEAMFVSVAHTQAHLEQTAETILSVAKEAKAQYSF